MKLIAPSALLREAAAVLEAVRDHVVVIGAAAVQAALDGQDVTLTPTRDVDAGISSEDAERIVAHLHAHDLQRSELPHERSFTWVKGELKVQLVLGRSLRTHPHRRAARRARLQRRRAAAGPPRTTDRRRAHRCETAYTPPPSS